MGERGRQIAEERFNDRQCASEVAAVLKEAAAKLSGEGLRGFPNHTNFSLDDPRVREIDGCIVAVLREGEAYAL